MANFKEHLAYISKHGVARSNRFQVLIPLPEMLQDNTSSTDQDKTTLPFGNDVVKIIQSFSGSGGSEVTRGLEVMVESTDIPGKSLTTTDVKYNSDFFKLPYSVVYNEQPLTFHCTRDMYEKNIIDEWMNLIYNPLTHEVGYMDNYSVSITINQLNEKDEVVYSVILKDAFPISCNPIPVTNEGQNEIAKLATNFAYKRWIREGENDDSTEGVDSLSQTPLGPILSPVLSNPAVQRGLDFIENETGLDLEGEGVAIYNQIDSVVRNTTGTSVNKSISLVEAIRASIELNDKLTSMNKAALIDYVDKLLNELKG